MHAPSAQQACSSPSGARRREHALPAALSDASTYASSDPVEVRETHASWVFLVGERAFKLKKPIALGFLDYSTLPRRHHACLEEVRVNRELAPGIYLGVRAIVATDTGFALAPERAPGAVDYLVEMRRFREADTLAGLIGRDALVAAQLEAVARRLATFHRGATVVAGGDVRAVLDMWRENVRELATLSRALRWPVDLAHEFAQTFVRVHAQEIEGRRRGGLIRDGHGDLRCEHVLAAARVSIVDRIEFDPALRHTDIACDLAFLTMDLEALGQRWAAQALVSAYRQAGMDPGSDALLCFYAAHHALVRAKVALIAAAEHDGARSAELTERARSKWVVAERLCWRGRAPVAIVICGPAGSGKSTLARELSRRSGLAVISSDHVRKAAAGLTATERASPEHYSHRFTHHVYALLAQQAQLLLDSGDGVIVDASCRSRSERSTLLGRLRRTGAPRLVVRCTVPLELALERAAGRMRDPGRVSDADPRIVAEQYSSFQPLEELAPDDVLELDTTLPLDAQVRELTRASDRRLRAERIRAG